MVEVTEALLDTRLLLVDNQADPSSGTIRLKAVFPNKRLQLWLGTFANIRLITLVQHDGLAVPLDSWRISRGIAGRPPLERDFQRQKALNPCRCQRIAVSGLMIAMASTTASTGDRARRRSADPNWTAAGAPMDVAAEC